MTPARRVPFVLCRRNGALYAAMSCVRENAAPRQGLRIVGAPEIRPLQGNGPAMDGFSLLSPQRREVRGHLISARFSSEKHHRKHLHGENGGEWPKKRGFIVDKDGGKAEGEVGAVRKTRINKGDSLIRRSFCPAAKTPLKITSRTPVQRSTYLWQKA